MEDYYHTLVRDFTMYVNMDDEIIKGNDRRLNGLSSRTWLDESVCGTGEC
jgi:hypothetical protein